MSEEKNQMSEQKHQTFEDLLNFTGACFIVLCLLVLLQQWMLQRWLAREKEKE